MNKQEFKIQDSGFMIRLGVCNLGLYTKLNVFYYTDYLKYISENF